MPPKKKVKKTAPRKTQDIDIKIKGVNKKDFCGSKHKHPYSHCSGFWVFGSALAMILSYSRSEAILWAILHGVLSWFYVLFRAMQIWGWF